MRKLFKGFYTPNASEAEFIWSDRNTIFIFDTNALLNFYSYEQDTRNELFDFLEVIKDRVWLPHQVALEYQMRRLEIIARERDTFHKIDRFFDRINEDISIKLIDELNIKSRLPELAKELESFSKKINALIIKFRTEVLERQQELKPDVISHDSIRERFDLIFQDNIGKPFSNDELIDIYSEGVTRYEDKIPPGYKDRSKSELDEYIYSGCSYKKEFGDLIIWKQIIDMAKSPDVNSVVFITDEKKEDWWYQIRKKMIGPLQALQTEIYKETNIEHFKMYDTKSFLEAASVYANVKINKSSLEDILSVNKVNYEHFSIENETTDHFNTIKNDGNNILISDIFNEYIKVINSRVNEKDVVDISVLQKINAVKGVVDGLDDVGGSMGSGKILGVADEKNSDTDPDVSKE
ncbi:PIN-like domain-containing protein [Kluyvera ascorbata]|uniref:PIN-like domain-containing protein n=1 Tax=Kluyvera ascorbata TaxID=51288 RepID=UPI0028DF3DB3|nr:PIN-like domain-containing protein [Kluyvera ascorbata]MDT8699445.1 PIN domain-containing protein [Kluyvera ascorbata]